MSSAPAIEVEGLGFRYTGRKRPALRDLTFSVAEGETVLVLGPSGCGKSTLALCLNGVIPHAVPGELSGIVRIHGQDTRGRDLASTVCQVGIVFQDPEAQFCMLRVDEEIAFGLENLRVARTEMPARIERALAEAGLDSPPSGRIDWLSGGNKQRLALACTLAMEPPVLVFDEPTSNLDPAGARAVFATLRRLKQAGRHSIVIIEHRLDQLMELIDRVLVLGPDGDLLDYGEPHQVLRRQAATLDRYGIWKPQVSELAERLGLAEYPITVAEASEALTPLAGRLDIPSACAGATRRERVLDVRGLRSGYPGGPEVLHGVDLEVGEGDFLALVGPNGAGKSTVAHHLISTLPAPRGTIFLRGQDIRDVPRKELPRQVGYVFQNPEHQFVARTVFDELAFGPRLRKLSEAQVQAQVQALMNDFGLGQLGPANPFRLSHGEKRRLSVATMLILGQRILVLDEPTFGQDRRNAAMLLAKCEEARRAGTTILMITHDMRLVAEHARQMAVLDRGRVLASGAPAELFQDEDLLERAHLEPTPILELSRRLFGDRRQELPATIEALAAALAARPAQALVWNPV